MKGITIKMERRYCGTAKALIAKSHWDKIVIIDYKPRNNTKFDYYFFLVETDKFLKWTAEKPQTEGVYVITIDYEITEDEIEGEITNSCLFNVTNVEKAIITWGNKTSDKKEWQLTSDKEYQFANWNEVLDKEVEDLHEKLSYLDDVANIDDFIPCYNALLDEINTNTEGYTEWEEVGEAFKYSQSDWMCEIDTRIRPIIENWYARFCKKAEKSEIDYSEYISNFWNKQI